MSVLQTTWIHDFHLSETRKNLWTICSPASIAVTAPASAPQPLAGSLSSDQLSQIASYLTQNRGINGASQALDFTVIFVTSGGSTSWLFDSGVTHHMTFYHSVLTHYLHVSDSTYTHTHTVNGTPLAATHSRNITPTFDHSGRLTLSYVFFSPKLTMQLLFVGKITNCNCNILFTPTCIVQDFTGRKIGT